MVDFQRQRKEYEDHGLMERELGDCPFVAFRNWFQVAIDTVPGKWLEPNAMTLATSGSDGSVTARTVLLKSLENDHFTFFTNYESKKGRQLAENPHACLLFHWAWLGRQIRINGTVSKTSRIVSEEYFQSRPRGSQMGAVVSEQSAVIEHREVLQQRLDRLQEEVGDGVIHCPEHWGGYSLEPTHMEFWQGRTNRLHDRVVFERNEEVGWNIKRLSP
ncbi:MAG: pyridoxamine 5'-phosphate oxidase [Pirellulaceae bacterium]